MKSTRIVAVLGVGSLRAGPPVLAELATYAGERPMEIRLYDADLERLDLMERFLRAGCRMTDIEHEIISTPDSAEALAGADIVLLLVGENCARKSLGKRALGLDRSAVLAAWCEEHLPPEVLGESSILNLMRDAPRWEQPSADRTIPPSIDWPDPLDEATRARRPHQILRWATHTEPLPPLLRIGPGDDLAQTPIKEFLNHQENQARTSN